jgi:hypothetical protein
MPLVQPSAWLEEGARPVPASARPARMTRRPRPHPQPREIDAPTCTGTDTKRPTQPSAC